MKGLPTPIPSTTLRQRAQHQIRRVPGITTVWPRLGATAFASGVGQVTLVVTGVTLARTLGPTDRGHFALFTIIALIAIQLGPLGMPYALSFAIARTPSNAIALIRLVRRRYIALTVITTCVTSLIFILLVGDRPQYVAAALPLFVVSIPLMISQQAGLSILQGLQAFRQFNVLRIAPNAFFAVFALGLVVIGQAGFVQLATAWFASWLVSMPLSLLAARRECNSTYWTHAIGEKTSRTFRKEWIARFGRRSLLGAASPLENYRIDQGAVALFLPPASLGYYVVGTAFTNIIRFLGQSVGLVAAPHVARSSTQQVARRQIWRFLGASIAVVLPPATLLWLVGPSLVKPFFGPEFETAESLVRILVTAAFFYALRRVASDAARGAGYPLVGTIAEISSLVFALIAFAILIPANGVEGAAQGLAVASALSFLALCVLLVRPDRFDSSLKDSDWEGNVGAPALSPGFGTSRPAA